MLNHNNRNTQKNCFNCRNYKGGICTIMGQFVPKSFRCGAFKEK